MTEPVSNGDIDADLLAVRNLIAQTDKLQAKPLQTPRDPLPKQSVVDTTGARRPVQKSSSSGLKGHAKRVAKILWARIKAYRPECKSVLLTSMVLLLILKPFMVLGWVVFFLAMIVFFHFVLGSDDFLAPDRKDVQSLGARSTKAGTGSQTADLCGHQKMGKNGFETTVVDSTLFATTGLARPIGGRASAQYRFEPAFEPLAAGCCTITAARCDNSLEFPVLGRYMRKIKILS